MKQKLNSGNKPSHKTKSELSKEKNRKKEYEVSFERMKKDPEQMFLAEAGLGDFLKMIEDHEKS